MASEGQYGFRAHTRLSHAQAPTCQCKCHWFGPARTAAEAAHLDLRLDALHQGLLEDLDGSDHVCSHLCEERRGQSMWDREWGGVQMPVGLLAKVLVVRPIWPLDLLSWVHSIYPADRSTAQHGAALTARLAMTIGLRHCRAEAESRWSEPRQTAVGQLRSGVAQHSCEAMEVVGSQADMHSTCTGCRERPPLTRLALARTRPALRPARSCPAQRICSRRAGRQISANVRGAPIPA